MFLSIRLLLIPMLTLFLFLVACDSANKPGEESEPHQGSAVLQELLEQVESLNNQGRYEEAVPLASRAVAAAREEMGADHPDYADALNRLANLYGILGDYAQAGPLWRDSAEIRRQALGENHPEYANSLNNLAILHQSTGDYETAVSLFRQSMAIRRQALGEDHPHFAGSLFNLATLYNEMGDPVQAEPLYRQSAEIYRTALGEEHPEHAKALMGLADLLRHISDFVQAEPLYRQSAEIYRNALGENHLDHALALMSLASLYAAMGDSAQAEALYRQGIAIRGQLLGEDHPAYAASLNVLAQLYSSGGDHARAESLFQQSREIFRRALGEQHPVYAAVLRELAGVYLDMAALEKAESLSRQSVEILERTVGTEHPEYAAGLNSLAELYLAMGDYEKAEPLILQSMEVLKRTVGAEHPEYARSLNNLAYLSLLAGEPGRAEAVARQDMEIRKRTVGEEHPDYAGSLNNYALFHIKRGNLANAETLYLQSLDIYERFVGKDNPGYADSLSNLAQLYQKMGDFAKAEDFYLQGKKICKRTLGKDNPRYTRNLLNLASLKAETGTHVEAHDLFLRAFEINHGLLTQILGFSPQRQAAAFIEQNSAHHEALLNHVCRHPEAVATSRRDALNAWLQHKGVILDAHRRFQDALHRYGDPEALSAANALAAIRATLASLALAGPEHMPPDVYHDRLNALREESEALEARLVRISAAYAAQVETWKADCAAVAAALPKDAVLVEIADIRWVGPDAPEEGSGRRYVFFVLHPDTPEEVVLEELGDADTINVAAARLKTAVEQNAPETAVLEAGRDLYDLVFARIAPHLKSRTTVFLSPDGNLNLIPFEIMVDEGNRYLIDAYTFNYIAAGRDIVGYALNREAPREGPLIVGDPDFDLGADARLSALEALGLPLVDSRAHVPMTGTRMQFKPLAGARQEAEEIAQLLSAMQPEVRVGEAASREALLAVNAPRYLHLATHGFFLEDTQQDARSASRGVAGLTPLDAFSGFETLPVTVSDPMVRSGVALAGANVDADGLFTAAAFLDMRLRGTELVTLSACQTGLGAIQTGEGVFGLRRAVTQAGARSLVMSMWKVPDKETRELMVRFYQNLFSQEKPERRQALREAVLAQRDLTQERYGHTHPYFWGSFVFLGSTD